MKTISKILGYVGYFLLNGLNLLDHSLNWILLGDSDETVSARTARARNAGSKNACRFCAFLTWCQKVVTFGKMKGDHCDYALDKSVTPNTCEIWNWSTGKINETPVCEVVVTEKSDT